MSSGLKIGLIVAGAGVVGLLILRSSASAAVASGTPVGTPTNTGLLGLLGFGSNTAPPPATLATTPATTALSAAPGAPTATSAVSSLVHGLYTTDKAVISGAGSVVKGAINVATGTASTVVHAASSVGHAILSIF